MRRSLLPRTYQRPDEPTTEGVVAALIGAYSRGCDTVAMGVEYVTSAAMLGPEQLAGGFFEDWATPLSVDEHHSLLRAATHVVVAVENGQVVGFVTALSDGVLSAYIPLLEVLPAWRRGGVGTELVRRVLIEIGPLYMVDVMCDTDVFAFYERLGFQPSTGGVVRNYDWRARLEGTG